MGGYGVGEDGWVTKKVFSRWASASGAPPCGIWRGLKMSSSTKNLIHDAFDRKPLTVVVNRSFFFKAFYILDPGIVVERCSSKHTQSNK